MGRKKALTEYIRRTVTIDPETLASLKRIDPNISKAVRILAAKQATHPAAAEPAREQAA